MSKRERDKGLRGENEVRHIFVGHGWALRGLEGEGDHIALKAIEVPPPRSLSLHVECKRQERLALPMWLRQAAEEAPPGTRPVVVFRQNRGKWHAALSLEDLLALIG
jgi:hypothetical protein